MQGASGEEIAAKGCKECKIGKEVRRMGERNTKNAGWQLAAVVYIGTFSLVSLGFLEWFPYVHSDESWLAGLSRAMMEEGSIGVTEPFFDARPRYPHGIKTLFHLMQIGMISVFGYGPRGVRLLSWMGGAAVLWVCFLCGERLLNSRKKGLFLMIMFSLDIQFLYASHFGRQEILLCLVQWICLWRLFSPGGFYNRKAAVMAGICTGVSIGLHPNSFLLGTMNGFCFLMGALEAGKRGEKGLEPWRHLVWYVMVTAGFAVLFVGLSFSMDSQFLWHYFSNGAAEFGIDAGAGEKVLGFFGFLRRLYERNSGTYYVPDIRFQYVLFGGSFLIVAAVYGVMRQELGEMAGKIRILLVGAAGIVAGMMVIGRYNQTSILFLFPFGYMAAAVVLELFEGMVKKGVGACLLAAVLCLSAVQVKEERKKGDYEEYGRQIKELVPEEARVLGNLNMEFFMDYGCLKDYRNLPYALEEGGLEAYLERNQIEYIVYHQELDYLWEHRPYYNVIYGNVMFVQELREYCERNCQMVGSFEDPWYGIRVAGLRGQEEYARVTVYRRASSSSSLR